MDGGDSAQGLAVTRSKQVEVTPPSFSDQHRGVGKMIHPLTHPTRLALHSEAWLRHCLIMAVVSEKHTRKGLSGFTV